MALGAQSRALPAFPLWPRRPARLRHVLPVPRTLLSSAVLAEEAAFPAPQLRGEESSQKGGRCEHCVAAPHGGPGH